MLDGRGLDAVMREYLLVFLVAPSVTYLLTVVAREIALRTGAVAAVRDRDVHAEPIPYLGGLAMLGGLVRGLPRRARAAVPVHAARTSSSRDAGVVLMAGALVCAVGVLDDIFDLDALTKLGGQVLAAGLLVALGRAASTTSRAPTAPSSPSTTPRAPLLTLVVVIGTMNAVNFVDGLDGLAAGVVGIGAAAFFLYCLPAVRAEQPHPGHDRRPAQRGARRGLRRASCRTTSTRPASSWATPARC